MHAPPILGIFGNDLKRLEANFEFIRTNEFDQLKRLYGKGLPPVVSAHSVALIFGYSPQFVGLMMKRPNRFYRTFQIPKGKNKVRKIEAPRVSLKIIQKWIGHHIARQIKLPSHVCGFVPGKSIIDGAMAHCGCEWLFQTDISNFFQSTRFYAVTNALRTIGYCERGSVTLARLCCLNDNLAQGAPSSPALSNLVFRKIDSELIQFCSMHNYTYTRYADDIAVSGSGKYPSEVKRSIENIIDSHDYKIATLKSKVSIAPARRKVYGLLVNGKVPRLTKGYRNRIRALKHLSEHGRIKEDDYSTIMGHISYAESVEARIADILSKQNESDR